MEASMIPGHAPMRHPKDPPVGIESLLGPTGKAEQEAELAERLAAPILVLTERVELEAPVIETPPQP